MGWPGAIGDSLENGSQINGCGRWEVGLDWEEGISRLFLRICLLLSFVKIQFKIKLEFGSL